MLLPHSYQWLSLILHLLATAADVVSAPPGQPAYTTLYPLNGTAQPNSGDEANAEQSCVNSWYSWHAASGAWYTQYVLPFEPTTWDGTTTTRVVGLRAITTECDQIPRAELDLKGVSSWLNSTTIQVYTYVDPKRPDLGVYTEAPPRCALGADACSKHWSYIFSHITNALPATFPEVVPGTYLFGCPVPQPLCRTAARTLKKRMTSRFVGVEDWDGGDCFIEIRRIAMIYWPPNITSSNLCGNGGFGEYVTAAPSATSTFVTTVNEITFYSHGYADVIPGYVDFGQNDELGDNTVITGPFTFTSPTMYIAYDSAFAMDICTAVGARHPGSVIPVRAEDMKSLIYKSLGQVWNGSELDWAQQQAQNTFPDLTYFSYTFSTRSVNFADLREPVPAALYYRQALNCRLWDNQNGDCKTITRDRYHPHIIMPEALKAIDPAWSTCRLLRIAVQDPPIALSPAAAIAVPTPTPMGQAPAQAEHAKPEAAAGGGGGTLITPTSSPSPSPMPASSPNPSPRAPSETIFVIGTHIVTATPFAGPPASIQIGSTSLTINGPTATIYGQAFSLGPAGLLVGSNTIPLSLPTPQASGAVVTLGSQPVTVYTRPGERGEFVIGSSTGRFGDKGTRISGHDVRLSSGAVVVDATSTVTMTPIDATTTVSGKTVSSSPKKSMAGGVVRGLLVMSRDWTVFAACGIIIGIFAVAL